MDIWSSSKVFVKQGLEAIINCFMRLCTLFYLFCINWRPNQTVFLQAISHYEVIFTHVKLVNLCCELN